MPSPLDALDLPFMRAALAEVVLLGVAGGLLGAFIVLRRLAFFTHAVGAAAFPGLVAADAAGVAPQLAGAAVALGYTGGVGRARPGSDSGAATGLLLAAALAVGVVLASDVFDSGAGVDQLLFGTLVGLDGSDVAVGAAAAAAALAATFTLGRAWFAAGFDSAGTRALGVSGNWSDATLLVLVALAVVAALPAVGALLVAALFVIPAATARLVTESLGALLGLSVTLAVAEGLLGLYLAYWIDIAPGPAIAVLASAGYALVAVWRRA